MANIQTNWDVIIIGGGAAGFFAAIRCAEENPNQRVLILEKASQPLGKVLISGGGRCNVTHACFEPAKLITFYPRGGNELRGAFSRFQPKDTVEWFEERGVRIKTESDGRMFPVTDDSNTIANTLKFSAKQAGVRVELGASVLSVEKSVKGGFRLEVQREAQKVFIQTKKLMFATGGDRKSQSLIQALGHTIAPQVPSLFTFNIKDKRIHDLAGISVEDVT
ncbi:MAG TPA: aminoacetone oxidase family FAD-binding enzyme, partial [Anaerolineales bacterium]|nr:aminoacetone oxidase family FAD-binding enzyme [Anaerolineales bacterium]